MPSRCLPSSISSLMEGDAPSKIQRNEIPHIPRRLLTDVKARPIPAAIFGQLMAWLGPPVNDDRIPGDIRQY